MATDPADEATQSGRGGKTPSFITKLGLSLPVTEQDVKQAYFAKARTAHPDHGGAASEFVEVQRAFDEAIQFAKRNGKRLPWIGAQLPIYLAQERALDLIGEWGGRATVRTLDWLEDTVGEDFSAMGDRLTEIDLSGTSIGDEQLLAFATEVESLPFLETLNLSNTNVGDPGLLALPRLPALRRLDLRQTAVSQRVRKQFAASPDIERVEGASSLPGWLASWFGG